MSYQNCGTNDLRPLDAAFARPSVDGGPVRRLRIAIVGGGTAGWMTAATLKRRLHCDVTVIESARIAPIGVGEATIPSLVDWIENMQIDEQSFLQQTSGTYKLAIRFDHWVTAQHRYWHPFGLAGVTVDGVDWIHLWNHARQAGWSDATSHYSNDCLQQQLCHDNLGPCQTAGQPLVANYAFHLDAGKLAIFLRSIAMAEGVQHCIGDVQGCTRGPDGLLTSVIVQDQPSVHADLFIDCSGFAGVLIDKVLQSPWIDWSDQLICDRAVTIRTERTSDLVHPYTISTGLSAGWSWQIPLTHTTGNGYVYASRHLSTDQAAAELLSQLGLQERAADVREVRFRTGRRRDCWVGNCVAIGLAAGFVEPLESTGIFLVQRAIDDLVDGLVAGANHREQHQFNLKMETLYHEIRDFVMLHYVLSQRTDSAFWREAANAKLPDSLSHAINQYRLDGRILRDESSCFADANHHFIYAGAGIHPQTQQNEAACQLISELGDQRLQQLFTQLRRQQSLLRARLPKHHELLHQIHSPAMVTAA